jgi:Ca2+-binding RTX toxin-like protein
MRSFAPLLAVCAAVASVVPSTASGATVGVREDFSFLEVVFVAAPGERNEVVMTPGGPGDFGWNIHDPGAALVPVDDRCRTLDPNTVRCEVPASDNPHVAIVGADADLGDLDDTFAVNGPAVFQASVRGGDGDDRLTLPDGSDLRLFGGAGDDQLANTSAQFNHGRLSGGPGDDKLAGGAADEVLDGGGGRDEINGGAGDDTLTDGDVDGATGDAAPGRDVLDGSSGVDMLSYRGRTEPVNVNLYNEAPAGEVGERDAIHDIDSVRGGRGDDRLTGNDDSNVLNGDDGRDVLIGRLGNDVFRRGGAMISCGLGGDVVHGGRRRRELVKPSCEQVRALGDQYLPAYPRSRGSGLLSYRVSCPEGDARCSGAIRLRSATGDHRLLAEGAFPRGRWVRHRVDMPLTALGRVVAARSGGVRARLTLTGLSFEPPTLGWTIRLRTRGS